MIMDYKDYAKLRQENAPTIKLAGIEFYGKELEELLEKDKRYIIKYRSIYYLETANYKEEPKFKVKEVWKSDSPLASRGRFYTMNYKQVNNLLGREIFAF